MLTSRKIQGGKPINEKIRTDSRVKINIFGKKLFRIKALISFGDVEEGETGGWIEKEENP